MAGKTEKETNNSGERDYETKFHPKTYMKQYYNGIEGSSEPGLLPFRLNTLHKIFNSGKIRGRRLLDIGTGPCIHSVISASKWFDEITLTDFAEPNRRELTKWWKKEEGAWDWEAFFRYVANMEGNEQQWKHDEDNMREKIQGVYFCDVAQTNPLLHKCDPFDAITSCLCLETACPTEEAYEQAIKNVASLLKADGFLVMVGVLGESYYAVGESKFPTLTMSQQLVTRSLEKSGFEDITWYQFDSQRKEDEDFIRTVSNYSGSFVVTATKIGGVINAIKLPP